MSRIDDLCAVRQRRGRSHAVCERDGLPRAQRALGPREASTIPASPVTTTAIAGHRHSVELSVLRCVIHHTHLNGLATGVGDHDGIRDPFPGRDLPVGWRGNHLGRCVQGAAHGVSHRIRGCTHHFHQCVRTETGQGTEYFSGVWLPPETGCHS